MVSPNITLDPTPPVRPALPGHDTLRGADTNKYSVNYNSFSGADIRAVIVIPTEDSTFENIKLRTYTLGTVQTLSYSVFREKAPVRALGQANERGKTRGTRTVGGSIVFTTFDRNAFFDIMVAKAGDDNAGQVTRNNSVWSQRMPDQLPPFDIIVSLANEYGKSAQLVIYGIELISYGQVMSIENLITEATYQFTAGDVAVMRPGDYIASLQEHNSNAQGKSGASALSEYIKEKATIAGTNIERDPYGRF